MSVIETKDNLLEMLNAADPSERLDNCERVLSALQLTVGVWAEASYAYKGVEIAARIVGMMDDAERDWCMNHQRRTRVARIKQHAWQVRDLFHAAHTAAWTAA